MGEHIQIVHLKTNFLPSKTEATNLRWSSSVHRNRFPFFDFPLLLVVSSSLFESLSIRLFLDWLGLGAFDRCVEPFDLRIVFRFIPLLVDDVGDDWRCSDGGMTSATLLLFRDLPAVLLVKLAKTPSSEGMEVPVSTGELVFKLFRSSYGVRVARFIEPSNTSDRRAHEFMTRMPNANAR